MEDTRNGFTVEVSVGKDFKFMGGEGVKDELIKEILSNDTFYHIKNDGTFFLNMLRTYLTDRRSDLIQSVRSKKKLNDDIKMVYLTMNRI